MSQDKKEFYGKEVTDAIKNACEELGVAQEKLDIEVVETGSTGIFGLIRKKAHIRVEIKDETDEEGHDVFEVSDFVPSSNKKADTTKKTEIESLKSDLVEDLPFDLPDDKALKSEKKSHKPTPVSVMAENEKEKTPSGQEGTVAETISAESLDIVRTELLKIVELMGFPSTMDLEAKGLSVSCTLRGEFEENLAGVDGKVLDSLQYILRKVVSRKVVERLRITLNVGDFRERRLEDLKVKAVELAEAVKADGKTQALPALNPSERRAIHMILQEDKEIRSRSVGDGLFKKILIYKPGKGNRGGRKRSNAKGRQNRGGQGQKQKKES